MKYRFLFLPGAIGMLLFSCEKPNNNINFYHDYFPLTKGSFIEYKVTKIRHDGSTVVHHDTLVYYLKTVVGDTIIDSQGRIARKFYRYIFDSVSQKYRINDLWSVLIDKERAESVEENQRIIKLVFSPTISKEWDKNAFNDSGQVFVYYDKIHIPYAINNLYFDSTVFAEEDSTLEVFRYRRIYEVYATGVGMIKKNYQDFSITGKNMKNPINGKEVFYEVINYGVE